LHGNPTAPPAGGVDVDGAATVVVGPGDGGDGAGGAPIGEGDVGGGVKGGVRVCVADAVPVVGGLSRFRDAWMPTKMSASRPRRERT